ncbi:bifunctional demethylmenaquinone methyltransferase/2-methoxy-6-polyprenyl-1,4-benzoquinol methylase UbiE [Poseidonibacter ostreae]|mgnify:FL=1|jgi:demethylmenaquinone methyltransferase / 2-methoxy-6-polyprenyl-1,4-benzoquinol methylase|uniref:Demethylmenaquinone methyltransferase n=1 Tax=Poseidonibacter ostreae TaxID=2654171 RepID=A0A6L4WSW4_9BACT|nr:bifunctional demethylmenaquinone methyltransferase/2-methoxy-6-polyprenyl-1,4-benzoquinol methylase UbiE [Poseidonibacter ostreae]KAB7885069.1 bifunctional demethylmenaquinone methyltransferase/2-methoxy-6-polyprenyl-1,4-benzoquinol methylase UbiE [Poseidonibacter ostreae]KAB7887870.1 bifunctional demethylmenaquinone methyltransferase/2-methoxy-6-polyprenyl-1,4-benzoquinol methylase UbiE [Poseidonibacter ostreae]KAB7891139.1 bifunctional demethylmenaquinone methyltransferase/2-methoxy-6-polyp|tara:strand:+ start:7001 stop:7711 length:711 start_codon:yes stop_codon:yes gene_type:complete
MGKQEKIVSMFNDIAGTYDVANRVLSMGIDKSWRNKACNLTFDFYGKEKIEKIVDVACGTGDMIQHWKKIAAENSIEIENIIGIDPSVGMMAEGKKKLPEVEFIEAGAACMPLENDSTDIISISYGIRNVVQRQEAFHEFARVLKKDGLVAISEFTKNEKTNPLDYLTDFYMNKILPVLGGLISKNKEAYTYLPDSIDEFLTTDNLCKELKLAGLEPIHVKAFSMNISTLIIARKI